MTNDALVKSSIVMLLTYIKICIGEISFGDFKQHAVYSPGRSQVSYLCDDGVGWGQAVRYVGHSIA